MSESSSTEASPGPASKFGEVGSQTLDVIERAARHAARGLQAIRSRRGMSTAAVGAAIVAVAWVSERDSAWGLPVLITGGLLIAIGMIGSRLSGSLSMRWGEDGAFLELKGTVAPPGQRRSAPALPAEAGDDRPEPLIPPTEVEGQAETIEFNVEALREVLAGGSPPAAAPTADPTD